MNKPDKDTDSRVKITSRDISTKQKGDIAEARIAELVTLYGDTRLSCYKPVSDDEGIDLIVKEKGTFKILFVQIKSRFGDNPNKTYHQSIKETSIANNYSNAVVFCFFNIETGDLNDKVWFVPGPEYIKHSNRDKNGRLAFAAKTTKKDKWSEFLINKSDLANKIIAHMKKL